MEIFIKLLYHYILGVFIFATIIGLLVLFDYFINGYFQYPQLINFIDSSILGGFGVGLIRFAYIENKISKQKKITKKTSKNY
jgi:hypothetical protein